MTEKKNKNIQEISFIGAGIATAYSVLSLLETMEKEIPITPVKITIIDKYPEFFKGIPYGDRSGNTVLLINPLNRFMPEPYRGRFVEWLNRNSKNLIKDFVKTGGDKTKKWVSDNRSLIDSNQWDSLYIPRHFFGAYVSESLHYAISKSEKEGHIKVSYVVDHVVDIDVEESLYGIKLSKGVEILSKHVVLSVGSLPTKQVFGEDSIISNENFLLINDLYEANLPKSFEFINSFLQNKEEQTNMLVLGANASALETLYKVSDDDHLKRKIARYTVLSSQGVMPDSDIDLKRQKAFNPIHLKSLQKNKDLKAEDVAKAAYNDLGEARKIGLGAASTVDVISKHVSSLLTRLNFSETKIFACKYGNSIGRMQRCAGTHYTDTVKELNRQKQLRHLAGRFLALKPNEKNKTGGLSLEYVELLSGKTVVDPIDYQVVVNCLGGTDLNSEDTPELLNKLMAKSLIRPNSSGIGLHIDSEFQASKNLYILGPLLAGNIIDKKPLWHLEHCGRIIWSSSLMAKKLFKNL